MPILLAQSTGPDILVAGGVVMVGRHPDCDVRLNSVRVSRRHCILAEQRGDVVVRDLGSTNGTWINGRRVVSGRIHLGDELWIAHVRYYLGACSTLRPAAAAGERADRPEHESDSAYSSDL
jgi:pSer/pThr/pTyr-binding forkhead associated (FHA) protein